MGIRSAVHASVAAPVRQLRLPHGQQTS